MRLMVRGRRSSKALRRLLYRFKPRMSHQRASRPATHRTPRTHWRQRSRRLALVMAAIFGAGVLFVTPALATGPPIIESMTAGTGGEITVGAHINPEGLETAYEIWLECACDPGDEQAAGNLPAVAEVRAVTLVLSGLQPGRYGFSVHVRNAAGEASQRSVLEVSTSPGSFPTGTAPVEVIEAPYLGASTGQLLAIAEREARERSEREAKEREEKEALERIPLSVVEAERQHREEAEAAAVARRRVAVCVVPSLRGDTLSVANHALAKAHCRLGKVSRPRHHHGKIVVTGQNPRPGETLQARGGVTLTIGAKRVKSA